MSQLANWNALSAGEAIKLILACCGSQDFAKAVVDARPYAELNGLLHKADAIWWSLNERDWLEAFACHPRIGESPAHISPQFSAWSKEEQSSSAKAATPVVASIAEKNRQYEERHGFIYIVCASGRSAEELLAILERRIDNSTSVEIKEAAEQQRQITHLRLRKLFPS
jgi:2-oxo-4-hydroxy-4-carboxy-5-ureidoimidazoline decarboxylase